MSEVHRKSTHQMAALKKEIRYDKEYGENILLVPLIDDLGTMKVILKYAVRLAEKLKMKIRYFYVQTAIDNRICESNALLQKILELRHYNKFLLNKICRVYQIERQHVVLNNYLPEKRNKKGNYDFKFKADVLDFQSGGIQIGDLIYDTYLRYREQPTIDLESADFVDMIDYGERLTTYWKEKLRLIKPSAILSVYASYVHWGIPIRTSIQEGIDVWTLGSPFYFLMRPTGEHQFHTKNFHLYQSIWESIDDKEVKLKASENRLQKRLTGSIGKDIGYMKNSSFKADDSSFTLHDNSKPWAVIFLHCFFDSPHIYGSGLYPDFYEWIEETLNLASSNPDVDYLVKPHPNGLAGNEAIIDRLKEKYTDYGNIRFLDSSISNATIIKFKPSAVFTFYGTVAHEFAYLEFPVILVGDNPHQSFGFAYHPESKRVYAEYIKNVGKYGLPQNYIKNEVLAFYYMHYLYYSKTIDGLDTTREIDLVNGEVYLPDLEIEQWEFGQSIEALENVG